MKPRSSDHLPLRIFVMLMLMILVLGLSVAADVMTGQAHVIANALVWLTGGAVFLFGIILTLASNRAEKAEKLEKQNQSSTGGTALLDW